METFTDVTVITQTLHLHYDGFLLLIFIIYIFSFLLLILWISYFLLQLQTKNIFLLSIQWISYFYATITGQEYNRAEKWETHLAETLDTIKGGNYCIRAANINPYSPSWEGLSATSNLTPLSHPCSSTKVSSASSSLRNCTKISQSQLQASRLQSSGTGRFKRGRSPVIFTPQVYESKGPYQLSSDGASCERMEDDTPEILKEAHYTTKVVKVSSPNQKRVSPPQSRAEKLRSSSPRGLRSGRKFILQAVPSFPPLSPYTDSKDAISDTRNGRKGTNNN